MNVSMFVCTHACMYACVCVRVRVCVCACMYACMCVCVCGEFHSFHPRGHSLLSAEESRVKLVDLRMLQQQWMCGFPSSNSGGGGGGAASSSAMGGLHIRTFDIHPEFPDIFVAGLSKQDPNNERGPRSGRIAYFDATNLCLSGPVAVVDAQHHSREPVGMTQCVKWDPTGTIVASTHHDPSNIIRFWGRSSPGCQEGGVCYGSSAASHDNPGGRGGGSSLAQSPTPPGGSFAAHGTAAHLEELEKLPSLSMGLFAPWPPRPPLRSEEEKEKEKDQEAGK
eukprot:GHVU01071068.1.p2 GENE.GHVU01071068.1~~GHVU01071068.1.p2  ORF type:complete len:280 (-),score=60.13 GHVU01071068.1:84-923(-)